MVEQMHSGHRTLTAVATEVDAASGPDFEPVSGVTLAVYAEVSRGVASAGNDQTQAPVLAAAHGISPSQWDAARVTWNARMTSNPAVGRQFSCFYRGV